MIYTFSAQENNQWVFWYDIPFAVKPDTATADTQLPHLSERKSIRRRAEAHRPLSEGIDFKPCAVRPGDR
jgi:hypothetical protein